MKQRNNTRLQEDENMRKRKGRSKKLKLLSIFSKSNHT